MAEPEPRTCYRHPDRETGLSCSECGRSICYECMTPAAVGIRCPEHSGKAQGVQRVTRTVQRAGFESVGAYVTKALVAINVAVYLAELAAGGTIDGTGNRIYFDGALYGPAVAAGDWWRLLSAPFLHYGPIHLGMNMLALWWFGQPLEHALGSATTSAAPSTSCDRTPTVSSTDSRAQSSMSASLPALCRSRALWLASSPSIEWSNDCASRIATAAESWWSPPIASAIRPAT